MVFVTGYHLTEFNRRKDGSSYRDWISETFEASLEMSCLDRKDIDTLIVSSESDFFTLQLNPSTVIADDLGLYNVEALRVEGGGASGQLAVHQGIKSILSNTSENVAVIGFDPSASNLPSETVKKLYSYSFDAWTDGMNEVTATSLYALSIQIFMDETGLDENDLANLTINNRNNACLNPGAHLKLKHTQEEIINSPVISSPYRRLHCSPLSDGAASIILSNKISSKRKTAPSIIGIGSANDKVNLGARDEIGEFKSKKLAMKKACQMAQVLPSEIGFAEVYDAYAGAQFQAINALGLSNNFLKDFRDGVFNLDGKLPINISGGLMGQGAPVGATGVGQTATCAMVLEGNYHDKLQFSLIPKFALADTHGGVGTNAAVSILQSNV